MNRPEERAQQGSPKRGGIVYVCTSTNDQESGDRQRRLGEEADRPGSSPDRVEIIEDSASSGFAERPLRRLVALIRRSCGRSSLPRSNTDQPQSGQTRAIHRGGAVKNVSLQFEE